jgi:hypothetical protein
MHLVHTDRVLARASSAGPAPCRLDAIAGLEFQTTDRARVHLLLAHVVDVEGNRLEIGRVQAPRPGRCLHIVLFAELLAAGLRAPRPLLVVVDHCPSLAARVRAAFGWRAHILDDARATTSCAFESGDRQDVSVRNRGRRTVRHPKLGEVAFEHQAFPAISRRAAGLRDGPR